MATVLLPHFPNCYVIPGKNSALSAARRQHYFNKQWTKIVESLKPKFGLPFAADVVLLQHDLFWTNEPVHNSERPTELFKKIHPDSTTRVIDIAPGFQIADGEIVTNEVREPTRAETLARAYKTQIARANRHGETSPEALRRASDLLKQTVDISLPYLREFRGNYRILLRFHGCETGIVISKSGRMVDASLATREDMVGHFDLVYKTRLPYLISSLSTRYGNENTLGGLRRGFRILRSQESEKQHPIGTTSNADVAGKCAAIPVR